MNFSKALEAVKEGNKITRESWNGKGQFVYHVPAASYPSMTNVAVQEFGDNVAYNAYLAIKTVDDTVSPWLASQCDLLAEDWSIA